MAAVATLFNLCILLLHLAPGIPGIQSVLQRFKQEPREKTWLLTHLNTLNKLDEMFNAWTSQSLYYSELDRKRSDTSLLTPFELRVRLIGRRISQRTVGFLLFFFLCGIYLYGTHRSASFPPAKSQTPISESAVSPLATVQNALSTRPTSGIGKVTMMYGDKLPPIYNQVLEGHRRHAELHGYEMFVLREKLLGRLWSKSAYMLSILLRESEKPKGERLKWLFWFDADVILLNSHIPLEIFLPPEQDFRHINLIVTNDHNGLNSGGFFIRVSEWAIQFFADAVSMPTYRPDLKLKYSEQSAMENLAKDDLYRNQTVFVPQRWFNAYRGPRDDKEELKKGSKVPANTVQRGDLQIHFAGKPENKERMPAWIEMSEKEGWQVPLESTSYRQEINDFWDGKRHEAGKTKSG